MKIVVSFSGGKDSQASLIWTVKKFGAKKVNYLTEFSGTLFEDEPELNKSCMSFYGICE